MAKRIANGMAIAMTLVSERNMAHSTPLHSYVRGAVVCGSRQSLSKSKVTVTYGSRLPRLALEIQR